MKLSNAQKVVEYLAGEGVEAEVYEDYSGRNMYGKTTAAVLCDETHEVMWAMGELGIRDSMKVDNLGKRWIVY